MVYAQSTAGCSQQMCDRRYRTTVTPRMTSPVAHKAARGRVCGQSSVLLYVNLISTHITPTHSHARWRSHGACCGCRARARMHWRPTKRVRARGCIHSRRLLLNRLSAHPLRHTTSSHASVHAHRCSNIALRGRGPAACAPAAAARQVPTPAAAARRRAHLVLVRAKPGAKTGEDNPYHDRQHTRSRRSNP
jgi:hypothetical protein